MYDYVTNLNQIGSKSCTPTTPTSLAHDTCLNLRFDRNLTALKEPIFLYGLEEPLKSTYDDHL